MQTKVYGLFFLIGILWDQGKGTEQKDFVQSRVKTAKMEVFGNVGNERDGLKEICRSVR